MLFLLISFIAGALTVLAPCVLPLVPVIVGGTLAKEGGRKTAGTVIASLAVSVFLFTLLLKVATYFINIPEAFWQWFSGLTIILLGLSFIASSLWARLMVALHIEMSANALLGTGYQKKSMWGDIIMGAALGPVFSTCSPTYFIIIATVLPASPLTGLVYLLAYIIGLSAVLFAIVLLGDKLVKKLNVFADPNGRFKKWIGAIFIILGILIATGAEKQLETKILSSGYFDVTQVEQKLLQKNETNNQNFPAPSDDSSVVRSANSAFTPLPPYQRFRAPEFVSPDGYVNTDGQSISLAQYKGKSVVLVDFWTYSCINCQRTLPYVEKWYEKYKDHGLVVVGVHTPEFAFEKKYDNVKKAVADLGLTYPVILDSEYKTWSAYQNQYWPRKYLIDLDGNVVYDHIGEGNYAETEEVIQHLLKNEGLYDGQMMVDVTPAPVLSAKTPELYFGAMRNSEIGNAFLKNGAGTHNFTLPENYTESVPYLGGTWNIVPEYITPVGESKIALKFYASKVFMVAGSDMNTSVAVTLDGAPHKTVPIHDEKLYTIAETSPSWHTLILDTKTDNQSLKIFTFTFQ